MRVRRITYTTNPERLTPRQKSRRAHLERAMARNKETRRIYNQDGCIRCGSHEDIENHHVFEVEGEKNTKIPKMWGSADRTFRLELAKTIPACKPCHEALHAGEWDICEQTYARKVLAYAKLRRSR